MPTLQPSTAPELITPLDLDAVDAHQLARELPSIRPHYAVDCAQLKALQHHGVSYVISQLLVLRRSGARIWLRNVPPALARCLRLLGLEQLFPTAV